MTERKAIVLDSGSGSIKCGWSGANFPVAVFPTVVGRPVLRAGAIKREGLGVAQGSSQTNDDLKDIMLGDETIGVRHLLDITTPVKQGVVRKVDDMCLLWDFAFSQKLKVDPKEHYVAISEAPAASEKSRNHVFSLLFERFGIAGIQCNAQGILALYSAGTTTGIAVDSGEGVTHCTPVWDGYSLAKANRRVEIGGRDVTENLVRLMQRRGYSFSSSADFEMMKAVKEMFCYAAVDYKAEQKLSNATTVLEKTMVLPDNTQCTIGAERFQATECLFNPAMIGVECDGLSDTLWASIQACDIDVRSSLYENVILSGGSTMFPGFPSRLERDMQELFVTNSLKGKRERLHRFPLKIHDAPRRKNMVFLGASCYAQLTAGDDDSWMTKAQYEEGGDALVSRMFGQVA